MNLSQEPPDIVEIGWIFRTNFDQNAKMP